MPTPFGTAVPETKSTATQWVSTGAFGQPITTEWSLENAIVRGYEASTWVYACATILARHVAKMPWKVWEPGTGDDLQVVPGHPVSGLIENPNEHHTRSFQMTMRTLHLCLGGDSFDKVVTVGRGGERVPDELWTMRPDRVRPKPHKKRWIRHYEVRGYSGAVEERLTPDQVVHAMFPNPGSPYQGMAPLRAAGKVVDMDVRQVDWNRELADNDMAPAGVFVDPKAHTEADRKLVKKRLKLGFSGPGRAREPMVLSGGAKWHQLGISPRELDWIESRKFTVGEICTVFGLLTARFVMDAQTYSNLDAAIRYEIENGALPIAGLIGDALGLVLLSRQERRAGLVVRPDTRSVPHLRENVHKAAESFETLVRNTIPVQTAAAIVDLPVGDLPLGERQYRAANLEEVTPGRELDDKDL